MPGQQGQVLPMMLALLLIVAAAFYFMVNSSQAVTEKVRVTNAADAAAMSAGVVEARALNFDAYLNRAIVANQLAIAQMVSLASWIDYFGSSADNLPLTAADVAWFMLPDPQIIYLEAIFAGTDALAWYFGKRPAGVFAKYLEDAVGVLVTAQDVVSTSLSATQSLVQLNLTLGYAQGQVAQQVVETIDPAFKADVVLVTHGFDFFTRAWGGEDRDRLRQTLNDARDDFTRERNWTICSFDIPLIRKDGCMKKRGGTEWVDNDNLRAVDTREQHGRRFGCGRFGLDWCDDIRLPLGWGGVRAGPSMTDPPHGYHGGAYVDNPTTVRRADIFMHKPPTALYSGLPAVRDLADLNPDEEPTTGITIRVSKPQGALLTSGGAAQAKPSGRLQLFDGRPAGGEMVALARAQVFFDRIAQREDGGAELASLYNPYWRVRLVQPLVADKAWVALDQGMLLP